MFTSWQLGHDTCLLLADRLRELRPALAVEVGSGFSTAILALYCGEVISLEHERRHAPPWPCVRIAPLQDGWYRTELPDGIEFALIDGPPARRYGRGNTLRKLAPHLAPGAEVWLDDAHRDHERSILVEWERDLPITWELTDTAKGLAVITWHG